MSRSGLELPSGIPIEALSTCGSSQDFDDYLARSAQASLPKSIGDEVAQCDQVGGAELSSSSETVVDVSHGSANSRGGWVIEAFKNIAGSLGFLSVREPVQERRDYSTKSRAFFNQEDVLAGHPESAGIGLCAPLSNLYVKHRLGVATDQFRMSPNEAYNAAVNEENHQLELLKEDKDGLHSAFVDSHVKYDKKDVPVENVQDLGLVKKLLEEPSHTLLTYPVKDSEKYHMIAFGRTPQGKCYYYDANDRIPVDEAPCDKVALFAESRLNKVVSDDGRKLTVASAKIK